MNELNVFFSNLKHIQNMNQSVIFYHYLKSYNYLIKRFFKLSSVSFCFRIIFKPAVLEIFKDDISNKHIIKNKILSYINNKENYYYTNNINYLKAENLEIFLKSWIPIPSQSSSLPKLDKFFENSINLTLNDIFSVEILLVKRAKSIKDKYSGHIAFPGGKFEKKDINDFNTAIRETLEETGINLNQDLPIMSRYLGPNVIFDITMDFRFMVNSHLFVIFDFFKECDNYITLSTNELSDYLFIPIDYLLKINPDNQEKFTKLVPIKLMNNVDVVVTKLILLDSEEFLIYGLTLRKIINFLNISQNNFNYIEKFDIDGVKFKKILLLILLKLFKFFVNPMKSYILIKRSVIILFIITILKLNWSTFLLKSKF